MKGDRAVADALKVLVLDHLLTSRDDVRESGAFLLGALWMLPACKAARLLRCFALVVGVPLATLDHVEHAVRRSAP
jgi:hypothetical protein